MGGDGISAVGSWVGDTSVEDEDIVDFSLYWSETRRLEPRETAAGRVETAIQGW